MKLPSLLLVVAFALSVSCASKREKYDDVPVVQNRDAYGRYVTPACPVCGERPAGQGTYYICPKEHVFASQLRVR